MPQANWPPSPKLGDQEDRASDQPTKERSFSPEESKGNDEESDCSANDPLLEESAKSALSKSSLIDQNSPSIEQGLSSELKSSLDLAGDPTSSMESPSCSKSSCHDSSSANAIESPDEAKSSDDSQTSDNNKTRKLGNPLVELTNSIAARIAVIRSGKQNYEELDVESVSHFFAKILCGNNDAIREKVRDFLCAPKIKAENTTSEIPSTFNGQRESDDSETQLFQKSPYKLAPREIASSISDTDYGSSSYDALSCEDERSSDGRTITSKRVADPAIVASVEIASSSGALKKDTLKDLSAAMKELGIGSAIEADNSSSINDFNENDDTGESAVVLNKKESLSLDSESRDDDEDESESYYSDNSSVSWTDDDGDDNLLSRGVSDPYPSRSRSTRRDGSNINVLRTNPLVSRPVPRSTVARTSQWTPQTQTHQVSQMVPYPESPDSISGDGYYAGYSPLLLNSMIMSPETPESISDERAEVPQASARITDLSLLSEEDFTAQLELLDYSELLYWANKIIDDPRATSIVDEMIRRAGCEQVFPRAENIINARAEYNEENNRSSAVPEHSGPVVSATSALERPTREPSTRRLSHMARHHRMICDRLQSEVDERLTTKMSLAKLEYAMRQVLANEDRLILPWGETGLIFLLNRPNSLRSDIETFVVLIERMIEKYESFNNVDIHDNFALKLAAINFPDMPEVVGHLARVMLEQESYHKTIEQCYGAMLAVLSQGDSHIQVLEELLTLKKNGGLIFPFDVKLQVEGIEMPMIALNTHLRERRESIKMIRILLEHASKATNSKIITERVLQVAIDQNADHQYIIDLFSLVRAH